MALAVFSACSPKNFESGTTTPPVTYETFDDEAVNVLILFIDDLGTDQVSAYGEHPEAPHTPTMDALSDQGVLFRNAYSYPVCSAARAALMTGRMGRRTGVGDLIGPNHRYEVHESEVFLPEMLAASTAAWSSLAVGKWHLAGTRVDDWQRHAMRQGFTAQRSTPGNVAEAYDPLHTGLNYTHFERLVDGELGLVDGYATTVQVDDALAWIDQAPEPWLSVVSFNAAHGPFQPPPEDLLVEPVSLFDPVADRYAAIVMALDAEMGRLLDRMDPEVLARTMVVVMGDNGTPENVVKPPWEGSKAKHTVYEGGTNVPLIVAGAGVTAHGEVSEALVHVVDVFPTVAEVAQVDLADVQRNGAPVQLDGFPLQPLLANPSATWNRTFLYTERFGPFGAAPHAFEEVAIRDADYKYMLGHDEAGAVAPMLFHLRDRVDDGPNLLAGELTAEAEAAHVRLVEALAEAQSVVYDGG